MARKNNVKSAHPSSILFDSRTGTVMAGPDSNDNIKEKVQAVREVVMGKSNNEIVLVLQYYDYNVEKAIQAYLEDGAKEALGEWHVPPAKPNKKKKNKKKATANSGQMDNGPTTAAAGAMPATPAASLSSTSLSSSQPAVSLGQPLPQRLAISAAVSNGINNSSSSVVTQSDTSSSKPLLANGVAYSGSIKDVEVVQSTVADGVAAGAAFAEVPPSDGSSHPSVSTTTKQHPPLHRVHPGAHNHGHAHGHSTQRTRTTSERSTTSSVGAGGDNHPKKPFQGLEKAIKDLQRQTTSLERLGLMLDHEIERSYKSVRVVFEEMRSHLNTREKQVMMEMDAVKQQAYEVFKMRQEKAANLKVQIERAEKLSESELGDLRADVKHFVADRKMDEELGKTTRFQYDSDHLRDEILRFGEVMAVKSNYTVRRPSASSVASSGPGVEEIQSSSHHSQPAPPVASHPAPTADQPENVQMTTEELAELQVRLQNSLKIQGLVESEKPAASDSDNAASNKDDFQPGKSARRRNRNRERQEQPQSTDEPLALSSNLSGEESSSRAATPSSTQASAGSASPSPQRGQRRTSPLRGGGSGGYRGRGGRGGPGGAGGYRGGQQGRGSPRRPYSGRGGGRGGGGEYYRQGGGGGRQPVVVNGGSS